MAIAKIITNWTGLPGGPGFTIVYVNSTAASPNPMQAFWAAVAGYLPSSITVTVPNSGPLIDETTGKQVNVWTNGTQVATVGTGTNTFAPQSGAQVKWTTGAWQNGRRVVGRMYVVPISTVHYGTGGVVSTTVANAINAAATTMISSYTGNLLVWTRPIYKKAPVEGDPPVLVRQGSIHAVSTATTPTKPATLTGRRDT